MVSVLFFSDLVYGWNGQVIICLMIAHRRPYCAWLQSIYGASRLPVFSGNWWVLSFPSGQTRGSIDDTLTAYLNLWDAMEYFKAPRTFSILQFQGIWSVLLWLLDACWPCTYPSLWGAQEFSFFPFLSFWFGFCTTSVCVQGILTALCWKKVPGGVGN